MVVVSAAVVSAVVAVSLFLFNFKMAAKIKYLFFSSRLFFDGVLRKTSLLLSVVVGSQVALADRATAIDKSITSCVLL